MKGMFIGVKQQANTFAVEKKFYVDEVKKSILKATALGTYFAEINGVRVGKDYLAPGWTSYDKTLQVQEYDVTDLLKKGENEIVLTVNEGWYCGPLTWDLTRNNYGKQTAVCAELTVGDKTIVTDESWTARESYIRESGIYHGEIVDYTASLKPLTICVVPFDKTVLVPQQCEPVRDTDRLNVKEVFVDPDGKKIYDFGQNMAGVVEIVTPETFNGTLTLRFGELMADGRLYTENLRKAKATDIFTVKGKKKLVPEFTFHGFRYMELTGGEIPTENITAIVRHTDMKRTGKISTSNARFNRFLENVVWGQRSNFVDIPSDCPQRDERLGWTGDINAFCGTAALNYDIRAFMKKWLNDVRNDQSADGKIPSVVPNVTPGWEITSAMWADCVVMIPWKLYNVYGDISYLSDNLSAMKKFIEAREATMDNGLIAKGYEYGDWLALDIEKLSTNTFQGRTDMYFLVNVLHIYDLYILSESCRLLGKSDEAEMYKKKREIMLENVRKEYFSETGRICFDTVTAQVVALYFDIVPDKHKARLAKMLNDNVINHCCKVVTGFIGTPFLLFALADNGYFETARRVLMNSGYPGWLYEVDMGATTIWERWNSLIDENTPNPDGMNSYNHYAYGSAMEFVYRRIAGIQQTEPGFKKITVAPNPCKGLAEVRAEYDSISGRIVAGYKQENGKIRFFAEIPDGVYAEIVLPNEGKVAEGSGKFEFERDWENLDTPPFDKDSFISEVFENPKAKRVYDAVIKEMFPQFTEKQLNVGAEYLLKANGTIEFLAQCLKYDNVDEIVKKINERFVELTTIG